MTHLFFSFISFNSLTLICCTLNPYALMNYIYLFFVAVQLPKCQLMLLLRMLQIWQLRKIFALCLTNQLMMMIPNRFHTALLYYLQNGNVLYFSGKHTMFMWKKKQYKYQQSIIMNKIIFI